MSNTLTLPEKRYVKAGVVCPKCLGSMFLEEIFKQNITYQCINCGHLETVKNK